MESLQIKASIKNLERVLDFINAELERMDCSIKDQIQIDMAVEELFVNVAHYAYEGSSGDAVIDAGPCRDSGEDGVLRITLRDWGVPFNPLEKKDPDISLSVEEREIGGLGIFMAKKVMDRMEYRYENGQNILTMIKKIH